jgi:hypothetical protein
MIFHFEYNKNIDLTAKVLQILFMDFGKND